MDAREGQTNHSLGGYFPVNGEGVFGAPLWLQLAADGNTGKRAEYGTRYRLSKDLRRGKNTENQAIFQLGAGFGVRVAGDDFVVVHPAFSVDESQNHDRIATFGNASGGLHRGVKETGAGNLPKGFIPPQEGLG